MEPERAPLTLRPAPGPPPPSKQLEKPTVPQCSWSSNHSEPKVWSRAPATEPKAVAKASAPPQPKPPKRPHTPPRSTRTQTPPAPKGPATSQRQASTSTRPAQPPQRATAQRPPAPQRSQPKSINPPPESLAKAPKGREPWAPAVQETVVSWSKRLAGKEPARTVQVQAERTVLLADAQKPQANPPKKA